ncbi:hypothetical protein GCM10009793_26100 [Brachybacterium phenoliresistens]
MHTVVASGFLTGARIAGEPDPEGIDSGVVLNFESSSMLGGEVKTLYHVDWWCSRKAAMAWTELWRNSEALDVGPLCFFGGVARILTGTDGVTRTHVSAQFVALDIEVAR